MLTSLACFAESFRFWYIRPKASWAPLIVVTMPMGNAMSTMADIIGNRRDITGITGGLQIMCSTRIPTASLSPLLAGARQTLDE